MSYRNKTYVAFASEDIKSYRLMEAWRENQHIEFSFYDAHDLFVARDTSTRDVIKSRLRERMKNAKQVVLLGTSTAKRKGGDGYSFLSYEVDSIVRLGLPVVIANLDGSRRIDRAVIPSPLLNADYYTLSTSFQPKIIAYALDNYAPGFRASRKTGPHYYPATTYEKLGM